MSTSYVPVQWGTERLSAEKLNQMCENDQWLFERTPTVFYNAFGVNKRTGGMKILSGVAMIPAAKTKSQVSKDINFGSYFSQGCKPIITTGQVMATGGRYNVILTGLSGIHPDHRGFNMRVIANHLSGKQGIKTKMYVHWTAVGY